MIETNRLPLIFCYIFVLALMAFNLQNCFFWDTVQLASLHGDFYYSTHFSDILLPTTIDSGHIPAFGMYIALVWKYFGRTMLVSHLAMVPFAIGIVYQLGFLCRKFIEPKYAGLAALMIVADPTILSQLTLVSPDVPLAFFFLTGIRAVLQDRKILLMLSVALLFLTSMRGMMVSLCLLFLDLYNNVNFRNSAKATFGRLLKRSLIYWPAALIFISFSIHHYIQKGWIGYHKDSPWADCFAPVDFNGFLFNIGIYGWRLLDFGRVGVWIVFLILGFKYRKNIWADANAKMLLLFAMALMVLLPANMLWAKNLLAHRYLIPIYVAFSLLCAVILFSPYVHSRLRWILCGVWMTLLISGNFWIYPPKISKGWDSTLAHLPYYKLRDQANIWIEKQGIDYKNIETFFPNDGPFDDLTLNRDERLMEVFDGDSDYLFYSNIFNIDDQTYDRIQRDFHPVKHFENLGVYITIYQKN